MRCRESNGRRCRQRACRTVCRTAAVSRATARALGETNVLDALKHAGFAPELARCPVQGTSGGTNWYRLQSASFNPGVLSVQSSCNGKPCEGFQLTLGGVEARAL